MLEHYTSIVDNLKSLYIYIQNCYPETEDKFILKIKRIYPKFLSLFSNVNFEGLIHQASTNSILLHSFNNVIKERYDYSTIYWENFIQHEHNKIYLLAYRLIDNVVDLLKQENHHNIPFFLDYTSDILAELSIIFEEEQYIKSYLYYKLFCIIQYDIEKYDLYLHDFRISQETSLEETIEKYKKYIFTYSKEISETEKIKLILFLLGRRLNRQSFLYTLNKINLNNDFEDEIQDCVNKKLIYNKNQISVFYCHLTNSYKERSLY